MKMIIPRPLKLEHKELHGELVQAIRTPGQIGKLLRGLQRYFIRIF